MEIFKTICDVHRMEIKMKFQTIDKQFDLVICGGGMPGICAAIQAARSNLKVALINNRGVLGGNASPEIRVHICGATGTSEFNLYSREGGIIGELLIENRYRNPQGNVYLWHTVIVDKLLKEKNCTVFLNTCIDTVNTDGQKIVSVEGVQNGSEKRYCFNADMFIDDTGDGVIGYLAGAEYMYGREGKDKWNETIAPEKEDKGVLLSSLSFYSKDFHRNMHFELPEFAKDISEDFEKALNFREIPDRIPKDSRYDGYRFQWYYETGAGKDQNFENEDIMHDHSKLVYNIWDYIKNHSDYSAEQFDLEYIAPVAGKRESRRLVGKYILKEQDVAFQKDFDDAVGYGGWSIDLHAKGGFFDNDLINKHFYLRGIYQIPFRSCCVKGLDNLMVASRCLSVSHVASGTTRLMSTLSLLGQACAMAAVMCKNYGKTPKQIGEGHIEELQQKLQAVDLGIVGKKKMPSAITSAKITASSSFNGKLAHSGKYMALDKEIGFVFPLAENNKTITLFAKATEDTNLKLSVYKPLKTENYAPEVKVCELSLPVAKSNDNTNLFVDLSQYDIDKNVFMVIEKNDKISLEVDEVKINGFRVLEQKINDDDSFVDIATLMPKPYLWKKAQYLPVFESKSSLYSAENINNGYIRNYGYPNLWLSEIGDETPEITIELNAPQKISNIKFTFDNLCDDLNYDTLETVYESNVWNHVIKDFTVQGCANGKWEDLATVKGNYQRLCTVEFAQKEYDKFKICLLATNGFERFGIYDIEIN